MPSLAAQVLQLVVLALVVIAFVRALMPRGQTDEPAFRRRRAEWLTVALGLVALYLVRVVVRALAGPDGVNPLGMIPFIALFAFLAICVPVLRRVWRRAMSSARDARLPEPELPSPRHTGLSGEDRPPTRW